jgi:hypothetical protein
MKKHIDWRRVGWTFYFILSTGAFTPMFYYRCMQNVEYNTVDGMMKVSGLSWLISGLFDTLLAIILFYFIKAIPEIFNFYYHNGNEG